MFRYLIRIFLKFWRENLDIQCSLICHYISALYLNYSFCKTFIVLEFVAFHSLLCLQSPDTLQSSVIKHFDCWFLSLASHILSCKTFWCLSQQVIAHVDPSDYHCTYGLSFQLLSLAFSLLEVLVSEFFQVSITLLHFLS